jgi:hypothetical protein
MSAIACPVKFVAVDTGNQCGSQGVAAQAGKPETATSAPIVHS